MLIDAWDAVLDFALDPARRTSVGELFDAAAGSDGLLSLDELAYGLVGCGLEINRRQLRLFQRDVDLNGDGSITRDEFMEAVRRFQTLCPVNRAAADEAWDACLDRLSGPGGFDAIAAMFAELGASGTGELGLDELGRGVVKLGVPLTARQMRAFQKALDGNNDGSISLAEFMEALHLEQGNVEAALTQVCRAGLGGGGALARGGNGGQMVCSSVHSPCSPDPPTRRPSPPTRPLRRRGPPSATLPRTTPRR